jgi:hypothetical protein
VARAVDPIEVGAFVDVLTSEWEGMVRKFRAAIPADVDRAEFEAAVLAECDARDLAGIVRWLQ